jgi:putative mRNA 3-end processing factor
MPLIEFTEAGLYCRAGGFYIDPWKPVDRAIITHAHSDHARYGSRWYLCHHLTLPLLRLRLGDIVAESIGWNEPLKIGDVTISLHPAGHIIGSAQIRIEHKDEVWVFSGDYKTEDDGISGAFEPVKCHTFITESTFGLPLYRWQPQAALYQSIVDWTVATVADGLTPVITGYSLGKAQRILDCLSKTGLPIFVHGAIWNIQQALTGAGIPQPEVKRVQPDLPASTYKGAVIVAPPGADGSTWMRRFSPYRTANCSGWMQVRGNVRRRNADAGFALSDHADWQGLLSAVKATGAEQVYVTHGFQSAFSRYLTELGIAAAEVKTAYGTEEEEEAATTAEGDAA